MLFTDEQIALRDAARRFATEQLLPHYQVRERTGRMDRQLVLEMGRLGLIGADLPQEHGGLGADGVTTGMLIEQLAYGDFNVSYVQLMASLMGAIIVKNASRAVVDTWIPRIVSGEAIIALGLTEPRGGSDAANLQMRARHDGAEWVLTGEKTSISFADQADAAVVFARTGSAQDGARGVSAFFVPLVLPGITRTAFDDVGSRIVGRGSIFLDEVRVPEAFVLGAEGTGFTQVMKGFDYSRILIALQCIAAAQASLDEAWAYVREREAFGAPLVQYQGVSFPLAEGETMLAAARELCYSALQLRDAGRPHTAEAAMVKWFAPKTAFDVIHQCLLSMGHYGWTMESPHQQRMRDVMGLEIGDGPASVMKLVIAREKVGRAAVQYGKKTAAVGVSS